MAGRGSAGRIWLWSALVLGGLLILGAVLLGPTIYRVHIGLDRYEAVPPPIPARLADPAILVFSKTNGYRDEESIAAANAMLKRLAEQRGWGIVFTENGAAFNPVDLARFKAVVWNSVSGDVLTAAQRAAFQAYLEQGGGFVGIHGAGGDSHYKWSWYADSLVGARFIGHPMLPQFQHATIRIEDSAHPIMQGLPPKWERTDEYYSFERSVRGHGYRVLASLDERTYSPRMFFSNIAMGDHPIIWVHCVGRGRAFFSALGHAPQTYSEPQHVGLLARAIEWASGKTPGDCAPSPIDHLPGARQ